MSSAARAPDPMTFNIIVAVWGEAYVSCLCDIALPSLAFDEADRHLAEAHRWRFLVYTTQAHEETIAATLTRSFPFAEQVFHRITPSDFGNPYHAMSHAHHLAAHATVADGARAIILPPDAVFGAGALAHVARVSAQGKRALITMGVRLREVTALAPLQAAFAGGRTMPARTLAGILVEHMHPEWARYDWASSDFSTQPYALMWAGPDGWLGRAFHLHPLMLDLTNPRAMAVLERDTIDGEFVGHAIGNWDDIHVVQDSDDLLMCTLTPDDVVYSGHSSEPASTELLRRTAYESGLVNALHRWYLTKAIKIHAGDLDQRWRDLEEETGHLVFDILSRPPALPVAAPPPALEPAPELPPEPQPVAPEAIVYPAILDVIVPSPGVDRYNNEYEDGVRICAGTEVQGFCFVGRGTDLNHVTLYPHSRIGRFGSIARGAAIGVSNHPITGVSTSVRFPEIMQQLSFVGVELGHDVWVGANATILAGVKVGHGAVIGAGSIVTKDVRPYAIVIGLPAQEIRRRFPDDICDALVASRWWELPSETLDQLPMGDPVRALEAIRALGHPVEAGPSAIETRLARRPAPQAAPASTSAARAKPVRADLAEANERAEALRIVLAALVESTGRLGLRRKAFLRRIQIIARDTPNDGPQSARHAVFLAECRRILSKRPAKSAP